jgi:Outer membrane protein beta-barrel family/Carboxypeptidase regulatory-like domain
MKKAITIIRAMCLCLLTSGSIFAQSPARISVKGLVIDSSSTTLPSATIMLLTPKDSALVSYGRTENDGQFEIKGVKRGTYLLKISYMGYLPYQQEFTPAEGAVTDLGKIQLKPIMKELYEVVIRTAKAPLSIKGDTVEYNAASFKVPPGSTVEDLLRKLPGMSVDQDGNIKAQGQDVKRVTVDGKQFFGGDTKMATKNLSAEAIKKVQVFNDKTEQAKATGIDDGKKEKTMNLELKDEFKKGGFGKVTAGIGDKERMEVKGNYNKFDQKNQFSLIGLGNNTNQVGMGFDDFQDFRGSQSFNWNDNADFGFGGGGRYYYFGGDEGDEDLTIPVGGGRGQGLTDSYAAGLNYNYDTKKNKLSSSYYFNGKNQILDALSSRQNFLENNTSFSTFNRDYTRNQNYNHRVSFRLEKTLDSLNTLTIVGNGKLSKGNTQYDGFQQFFRNNNELWNETKINNTPGFNSDAAALTAIFRHKFKKKGRIFALSGGYNYTNSDGDATQISLNYPAINNTGRYDNIDQSNVTLGQKNQWKASVLYVEPLGKKFSSETFYNFSTSNSIVDRDVTNNESKKQNDTLTRYFENTISYNRIGTSLRYNYKGINISAGIAGQQFSLRGNFTQPKKPETIVDQTYFAWLGNVQGSLDLKNNRYMWFGYEPNVSEPSIKDLQPVVDNSNSLFIREGNPDLLPQIDHNFNVGGNYYNPGSFMNVYFGFNYNYHVNQIIYNQNIDSKTFKTTTKPSNITGGNNVGTYFGLGFPLKKTKATMNINGNINASKNLTYINDILNNTNNMNYSAGVRLDLTPSDKFTFYGNANFGITNTKYSINTAQNQTIYNHRFGGEMNVKFPKDFFLNTRFNYNVFLNERFGFNQRQPIWNAAIYKQLGKSKKAEIRLTANDILNRNLNISQFANQNSYSESRTETLARYFMLSFTYNMRGVKSQMRRSGGGW